jgi:hypothetical protein
MHIHACTHRHRAHTHTCILTYATPATAITRTRSSPLLDTFPKVLFGMEDGDAAGALYDRPSEAGARSYDLAMGADGAGWLAADSDREPPPFAFAASGCRSSEPARSRARRAWDHDHEEKRTVEVAGAGCTAAVAHRRPDSTVLTGRRADVSASSGADAGPTGHGHTRASIREGFVA